MEQKTHVEVEKCENENTILKDFSGFKWMSFIPGKTTLDDVTVMEINSTQERFSTLILPDHYFTPTYCIQIVKSGYLRIPINNKEYEITANQGCLISPELLIQKPDKMDNYVEMLVLSMSREFMQELNLDFPLAAAAYIYVHPVWNISPKKMQRLIQYFDLMREVIAEKDRKAAIPLIKSFFYYLAEPEANNFPQQTSTAMSRNEEITGRFMHLVDTNCEQQHSLNWYADQLCLTTRYVANTVKQTLGITASACIEHVLVQRAKTLLISTTKSIQEIADQLGFQNQSHFGTFFKRHEGMSPAAFRKKKE